MTFINKNIIIIHKNYISLILPTLSLPPRVRVTLRGRSSPISNGLRALRCLGIAADSRSLPWPCAQGTVAERWPTPNSRGRVDSEKGTLRSPKCTMAVCWENSRASASELTALLMFHQMAMVDRSRPSRHKEYIRRSGTHRSFAPRTPGSSN